MIAIDIQHMSRLRLDSHSSISYPSEWLLWPGKGRGGEDISCGVQAEQKEAERRSKMEEYRLQASSSRLY